MSGSLGSGPMRYMQNSILRIDMRPNSDMALREPTYYWHNTLDCYTKPLHRYYRGSSKVIIHLAAISQEGDSLSLRAASIR